MKKNGRVKAKGKKRKSSKQSTGSCQNVSCLNTLLQVLKIDKDTVQNFIQQKKRIDSRVSLAGKKGNKSDSTDGTMKLLSASLGGTKALTKNAPICAGRYNETKGMEGVKLYKNMSDCDKLIQEACNFTLPASESAEVGKCNKVMGEFREGTEKCKTTPTNCSCWIAMEKDIQGVKKCNIAKDKEKEIKKKLTLCKDVFGACKKYEDKSIAYIATCKTSKNALTKVLTALYQSLEKLDKVLYKSKKIKNATSSSRMEKREGSNYTTSTQIITAITSFTTLASSMDADQIGSNSDLKTLAKNIAITVITTMTFTQTQITTINNQITKITTIRTTVLVRIEEVKTMLGDITGTTPDVNKISIETLAVDNPNEENTKASTKATSDSAGASATTKSPSPSPSPPSPSPSSTGPSSSTVSSGAATESPSPTPPSPTPPSPSPTPPSPSPTPPSPSPTPPSPSPTPPGPSPTTSSPSPSPVSPTSNPPSSSPKPPSPSPSPPTQSPIKSTLLPNVQTESPNPPGSSSSPPSPSPSPPSPSPSPSSKPAGSSLDTSTATGAGTTAAPSEEPDAPDDLQSKNTRLVENEEAANGVVLAISEAEKSTESRRFRRGFNSKRGIPAMYLVRLIKGFLRSMTRTVYSRSALRISKTILYTVSKKKVQAFTSSQITIIKTVKTTLVTVVKKKVTTMITSVREEMQKVNMTPEKLTEETLTFPYEKPISSESLSTDVMNKKTKLMKELKALLANRNGLEMTSKSITTALSSTSTSGATGTIVVEMVHAVEAIAVCLYGADLKETVLQSLSAELYKQTVVSDSMKVTEVEKTELEATLSAINVVTVSMTKQIVSVQSEIMKETGKLVDVSTLKIESIDANGEIKESDPVNQPPDKTETMSAKEEEEKMENAVTNLKKMMKSVSELSSITEKIMKNELTVGEETSVAVVVTKMIIITTKITSNIIDEEFTKEVEAIKAITKVAALEEKEKTLLADIKALLALITVASAGSISEASQGLIGSKGLVIDAISEDLSFEKQAEEADKQLKTNRDNCKGMDEAAAELETLTSEESTVKVICKDMYDDDCDEASEEAKTLTELSTSITTISSENLEDVSITTKATEIKEKISSVTVITLEQKNTLISLVMTMKSTVLIYVSQITIVESNKLEVAGALKFKGDSGTIDDVDASDFAAQKEILEKQVTNLFQIADSNDRVIECISKIENLPEAEEPKPNKDLKKDVDRVPAMCGEPEPPVEDIQKTSASIVQTCASATERPTEAEIQSLIFIKKSLISFKQTFSSQTTIFSQKLSDITGEAVTASGLKVKVISDSGDIGEAQPVDITGGKEEGTVAFFQLRYEIMKSSLNSIEMVMTKITEIQQITEDSESEEGSTSTMDFALLIAKLTSKLSSGIITQEIIEISQKILQAKVTAAPSKAVLILLKSAVSTVSSLQMTILSEIVVIKQNLMHVLVETQISITTIQFTIQELSKDGEISTVTETGGKAEATEEELSTSMTDFKSTQSILVNVEMLLKATLKFDFTSMVDVPTKEVTMEEFMTKVSSFMMIIGKSMTDSSAITALGNELMDMKMKSKGSEVMISKLTFIISTVSTYVVQITTEMTSVRKQMDFKIDVSNMTAEEGQVQVTKLTTAQESFKSVSAALKSAMDSTDNSAKTKAAEFLSDSRSFFISISTLTIETITSGSIEEITTISTKIVTASEGGVTPSSGKLKLLFQTIIQSITIFVEIIQIQITILGTIDGVTVPSTTAPSTVQEVSASDSTTATLDPELQKLINKFIILKQNEIAIQMTTTVIQMISNKTDFSSLPPSSCGDSFDGDFIIGGGIGSGSGSGEGPEAGSCGSDDKKSTSIVVNLIKGMKIGLESGIDEASVFSTAETVTSSVFKFKFEEFTDADITVLGTESAGISNYLSDITDEQLTVIGKIEAFDYSISDIEYKTIVIPPCKPAPMPPKEELMMKATGLFSNLEAIESVIEAVEGVIKGDKAETSVSVDTFLSTTNSLESVLELYNPCELFKAVIQEISALLVVLSTSTEKASAEQIVLLKAFLAQLLQIKLEIIVEINKVQSALAELTGSTVDPSMLDILTIGPEGQIGPVTEGGVTPPIEVLLPKDEEAKIEKDISDLTSTITSIELIIEQITLIIEGQFPVDPTSTFSCDDYFVIAMDFLTLLIRGEFGADLAKVADEAKAISSFSAACDVTTISYLQIIITALTEINVNVISSITIVTQTLIVSRGLIVEIKLEELALLSFEDQSKTLGDNLRDLRASCLGMDKTAKALDEFLFKLECGSENSDSMDVGKLIDEITKLTKISALNIEDDTIEAVSNGILTQVSSITSLKASEAQCKSISSIIIIIQNTVMTYVSQISILEQRKLQIGGDLQFTTVTVESDIEEEDFAKLKEKDEGILKGLMLCGGFTDRSEKSIKTALAFAPLSSEEPCSGREVLKKAQRITAMCSSEVLPIDDVADNTKDLARCSNNLEQPLSEREISSLEFIMISLNAFAITFSSQITIVQQRLSVLTGQTVTAADLSIEFIGPNGDLSPALPLDITGGNSALIPTSMTVLPLDEKWNFVGWEMFLVKQWTEFRFAFSTMQIVIKSISTVLDIEGATEASANFKTGTEFLIEVSSYFSMIGQGLFTSDLLYDITFNIIQFATQVTMEISSRIMILLNSITIGIRSFQMACGSEFIIIQQKLIQIVSVPVTSMQIEGTEFNTDGEVVQFSMGSDITVVEVSVIDMRIVLLRETLGRLQSVMRCIDGAIAFNFDGLGATKTVGPEIFIADLNIIILSISTDITGIDMEVFERFITYDLNVTVSSRQLETLKNVKSTVFSYCSMLAAEVSQQQSTKQDATNVTIQETTEAELTGLATSTELQITSYESILSFITSTVDSCGPEKEKSATNFFNTVFEFYILMVSEDTIDSQKLKGFITALQDFESTGIRCITGAFEIVFVVIKIAINIYIEITRLTLSIIYITIFEVTGSCPDGTELGDWSTGEGECCCDPDSQPDEEEFIMEEPVPIPQSTEEPMIIGEEPVPINGVIYEEPIPINGNDSGYGEEPVPIGGEEPVLISGGENIPGGGEEPVPIGGEEPVMIGGEEPVLIGGEEPVLVGGEEPVLIGGEEPVLIGGEEPVPIYLTEEPVPIPTVVTPPTLPSVPPYEPTPPKPPKKFCKCRKPSTTQGPGMSSKPTGVDMSSMATGKPTGSVPGETNFTPSILASTGTGTGQVPIMLGSTTTSPETGSIPFKLSSISGSTSTSSSGSSGQIPFKLPKTSTVSATRRVHRFLRK